MLKKILIANRGEIASRIIRSCQDLGLETLAVYAPIDRGLPFVREADQAIALPSNDSQHSYLNAPLLLEIAHKYGADALHPGYGFLSENASFAKACQEQGLVFIGPEPDTIAKMGSKIAARQIMSAAGIPVVPGFEGPSSEFAAAAQTMGYPVLIKASAGGGGRGMRLVKTAAELADAIDSAGNEALKAFGDGRLLLEKYLSPVRHIEVQIVGDGKGRVWHLLERECSLQRRYQKIIEEAPAPNITEETRQKLYQWALQVGELLQYKSLGTVEFAVDSAEQIYFLECNTRIQVEHPVTEAITGLDLVALQLQVANNQALELVQDQIVAQGHAFECRLYAEDPCHDFAPCTGTIAHFKPPQRSGYRCDTGIHTGAQVSVYYDALLAKLIAQGPSRDLALARMMRFLKETQIFGLKTNLPFLGALLQNPKLQAGQLSTGLIGEMGWEMPMADPVVFLAALMAYNDLQRSKGPLSAIRAGFRNLPSDGARACIAINRTHQELAYHYDRRGQLQCKMAGQTYAVCAIECGPEHVRFELNQRYFHFDLSWQAEQLWLHHPEFGNFKASSIARLKPPPAVQSQNAYTSQMPGKILKILVQLNEPVMLNQTLLVIESMKMETQILAQAEGIVTGLYVSENQLIESGTLCLEIT
ncbi:MAG: biotin carboxylase N-terminal domain-containing protein [Candidatus Sericytochromatia bacterium]